MDISEPYHAIDVLSLFVDTGFVFFVVCCMLHLW